MKLYSKVLAFRTKYGRGTFSSLVCVEEFGNTDAFRSFLNSREMWEDQYLH
jgi:hypothetical protein